MTRGADRMSTTTLTGGSRIVLCAMMLLLPMAASGQRIPLGADTLAALRAKLSAAARPFAEQYLAATTDTAARRAMERLRLDTTAAVLIFAALTRDPDVQIRTR